MVKKIYLFSIIAASIFILDQILKVIIRNSDPLHIFSWFTIGFAANSGAGFSIFRGQTLALSIVSIIAIGVIIYYYPKAKSRLDIIALSLVLGGALGNLVDRVAFGYVTDFVSISIFPVFNLADSAITIGVIILILKIWKT